MVKWTDSPPRQDFILNLCQLLVSKGIGLWSELACFMVFMAIRYLGLDYRRSIVNRQFGQDSRWSRSHFDK